MCSIATLSSGTARILFVSEFHCSVADVESLLVGSIRLPLNSLDLSVLSTPRYKTFSLNQYYTVFSLLFWNTHQVLFSFSSVGGSWEQVAYYMPCVSTWRSQDNRRFWSLSSTLRWCFLLVLCCVCQSRWP